MLCLNCSQRYKDRKRRREKEEKEDALDREAEEAELAAAAPIIQDDIAGKFNQMTSICGP